ncbi:Putative F-box-like domain superfamily protein [Septoria linicola]|uniref:F-box-like domain superfamily protein n=1 Tax=Septoria linicola TaxID=215465 RepID=A0A9Q9AYB8_9PEZI|nr:putative F-box-like domain superfamily protein [Septoria linicola]USW58237.1 Putative F-box-like domain superfamily protein [Septoria linicola]
MKIHSASKAPLTVQEAIVSAYRDTIKPSTDSKYETTTSERSPEEATMSSCDKEAASDISRDAAINLDTTSDIEFVLQVFETYELLEKILLRTDNVTVLRGQGVNKTWRDVIQRSENLQQKLFFKPVPVKKGWSWRDIVWNPLFLNKEVDQGVGLDSQSLKVTGKCIHFIVGSNSAFYLDKPAILRRYPDTESWHRMLYCQGLPPGYEIMAVAIESSWIPAGVRADMGIAEVREQIKVAFERYKAERAERDSEDMSDSD